MGAFPSMVTKMSPGTPRGGANSAPCAPFQEDIVQASSAAVSGSIHIWTIDISEGISEFESKPQIFFEKPKRRPGSFLKWFSPQTIHFNRGFHSKPSILDYPYFLETPRWTWLRQKWCFFSKCQGIFMIENQEVVFSQDFLALFLKELTCPQKKDYFNRKYIFQPSFCRGYVSFQGVIHWTSKNITIDYRILKPPFS